MTLRVFDSSFLRVHSAPRAPIRHARARPPSSSPTFVIGDPGSLPFLFFLDAGSGSGMTLRATLRHSRQVVVPSFT